MTEQAASILVGWSDIDVGEFAAFTLVRAVDPGGTQRVAHAARADVAATALLAQFEAEEAAKAAARAEALQITPPASPQDQPSAVEEASAPLFDLAPTEADSGAAPQDEPQFLDPPPAQVTPPSASAYAGTMLQEDRENYLRGLITVRVTQIERNRLEARFDRNAQDRQIWGWTQYQNLSAKELPIPEDVQSAHAEFLVADKWIKDTKAHADALRLAAITVGLDMLEAMQTSVEEGWP